MGTTRKAERRQTAGKAEKGEGVGIINPKGEGGAPPEQVRTLFVRGLIQEMGGQPPRPENTLPQRKMKRGGGDRSRNQGANRRRGGSTYPIRGERGA